MEKTPRETGNSGRCVKQSSKKHAKKRSVFYGRKKEEVVVVPVTPPVEEEEVPAIEEQAPSLEEFPPVEEVESATASVSTIADINNTENVDGEISGYRLIGSAILQCIFNCLACPGCFQLETLSERYT